MRLARPALILGVTSALALAACDSRDYEGEITDLQTELEAARSELAAAQAENEAMTGEMEELRGQSAETAAAGGEAGGAGVDAQQVGSQLVTVLEHAADGLEQVDQIGAEGGAADELRTSFLDIIQSVQATAEQLGIELQEVAAGAGGPEPAAGPEGEAQPEAEAEAVDEPVEEEQPAEAGEGEQPPAAAQ